MFPFVSPDIASQAVVRGSATYPQADLTQACAGSQPPRRPLGEIPSPARHNPPSHNHVSSISLAKGRLS